MGFGTTSFPTFTIGQVIDEFKKPEPVTINGKSVCYDERNVEPIWSFVYAGGDIGGSLGIVGSDPATGTSIGVRTMALSDGSLSAMFTVGGLSIGALYNGSIMPAIGYSGIYFYGNGISAGIFKFGLDGLSIAEPYIPFIIGFINTLPMIIQNAEALGEMEDPVIYVLKQFLKNVIYAAFPIALFEKIFDNKADISEIPPLNTKRGFLGALALLAELRSNNRNDKGKDAALLLYRAARSQGASPYVLAELLNQYDLFLRASNETGLPQEDLKSNLKWAVSVMDHFHNEHREWLINGAGEEPSKKEISEYMTAALLAAQKMPLVTSEKKNGCLKIKASAAVDFEGSEESYLKAMTELSHFLANTSSGLWKFVANSQEAGAGKLNKLLNEGAPTEDVINAKFEVDANAIWASNIIGLIGDGENRFNYLKWKTRDTSEAYNLATKEKMEMAYNLRGLSNEYVGYLKMKKPLDLLEDVFVQAVSGNVDNKSAIFADVYKLEEMSGDFTTTSEVKAHSDTKARAYRLLHYKTDNKLSKGKWKDLSFRYYEDFKRASNKLRKIPDKIDDEDPALSDIRRHVDALFLVLENNREQLFISTRIDPRMDTRSWEERERNKHRRHGDNGLLTKDISYDCQTFTESLKRTEEEVNYVIRHGDALVNAIKEAKLTDKKKADLLKVVNNYMRIYRLFMEKRNAIIEADALNDQGGKICQP